MSRSEVILTDNLRELLDVLAFIQSRKQKKRVTRSALIRECINFWWEKKAKNELTDSELFLVNPTLLEDLKQAKEDMIRGREYGHEEMLEALNK